MSWKNLVFVCALVAIQPGVASATAGGERDLASEVRAIFSIKCAGCHGSDLAKPRGSFGYILDLNRLRGNPDMVIPEKPEQSTLWTVIANGEMPPPDSPAGPLTSQETEVIRTWIAAGAPVGLPPAQTESRNVIPAAPQATTRRTLLWLGRFHLLLLHFPIALLLAAVVAEGWSWWRGAPPSPTARFCLCLGTAAVVPTVVLGWLSALGGNGGGAPGLLALHRWGGTVAGTWAVATAVLSEVDARRGRRSWLVRGMILAAGLLVALTAHFGGLLAHGKDYFGW